MPCASDPVGDGDAGQEQHAHRGEHRPALALVADHAAERVGQRRAEREDRDASARSWSARVGFSNGCARVGVEEAAAVGAQHLDHLLRGDRAQRDGLLGALQRRGLDIGARGSAARPARRTPARRRRRSAAGRRACMRVRSTQKLPMRLRASAARSRASSATAIAMPAAADRKFCTASPSHLRRDSSSSSRRRRSASWCW